MKLKLLHLYDDVMNLYGEYANVAVLARYWKDLGHEVSVDTLSLWEEKNIEGYDLYYMGAGTERKMKLMLPQLLKHKEALHKACDDGKVLLFTGNACDVLGRSITDSEGKEYDGLGLGDFVTTEGKIRITGDCLAEFAGEILVGFINKCSCNSSVETPLFTLKMGCGNEKGKPAEGFRKNNCLGTHLTGPILVKNPAMLRYVTKLLTGQEPTKAVSYPHMERSYEVTKEALLKRLET